MTDKTPTKENNKEDLVGLLDRITAGGDGDNALGSGGFYGFLLLILGWITGDQSMVDRATDMLNLDTNDVDVLTTDITERVERGDNATEIARDYSGYTGPITADGAMELIFGFVDDYESADGNYDIILGGATTVNGRRITDMTIQEILDDVPGAAGRYQFIDSTLRETARNAGIPLSSKFTPEVQDQLAATLLESQGRFSKWVNGEISDEQFARKLASIWAALPRGPDNRSMYGHVPGNVTGETPQSWDEVLGMLGHARTLEGGPDYVAAEPEEPLVASADMPEDNSLTATHAAVMEAGGHVAETTLTASANNAEEPETDAGSTKLGEVSSNLRDQVAAAMPAPQEPAADTETPTTDPTPRASSKA